MNFQHKLSFRLNSSANRILSLFSLILLAVVNISAQSEIETQPIEQAEDYTWWYVSLFVLTLALAAAVVWMLKARKAAKDANITSSDKKIMMSNDISWEINSLDADKELEWYRRQKKSAGKSPKTKSLTDNLPKTSKIFNRADEGASDNFSAESKEDPKNLQFDQLPIFGLQKLEMPSSFSPLAISNDEDLMSAIEQTQDEYEEDDDVRDLAVRILARFKTRNSVEALSQVALYDLSSNLRSKAVSVLADFDHESVFETILLCCADPTREVRAAAARGLFRLSFDRADAWARISETNDEFRIRQAAQAAKEADLVKRSFDRLVHPDYKIAYEAVTLIALMIRAGETDEIFRAIETHLDDNVKLSLLHVIGLAKEEETLAFLYAMLEKSGFSKEIKDKVDEVIQSFELIPA